MPVYALTIFLGAFLLFQVQPLIGKYILPWFGGGPGVWTTCLLFFQVVLLGGYAYAHWTARCLKPRQQIVLHLALLLGALALLPITPGESWKPDGTGNPAWLILRLLTACLGLPYLVLSATGPLLQHWFSRCHPGVSPYRLYALSNVGSLLALLSYPFYIETHFTRIAQARLWAVGLIGFVVCCAACARTLWHLNPAADAPRPADAASASLDARPAIFTQLLWLLLPACGSVLLLATTNKICQDVAVIPFLWVLPLAIYLLSFVIAFDHPRWYARLPFALALVAALVGVCWVMFHGAEWPLIRQLSIYGGGLFVFCLVCHGELFRLRPPAERLTQFYLMISAGGALGGVFVAVIAPLIFRDHFELHWGLVTCGLLFVIACARDANSSAATAWRWLALALMLATFVGLDQWLAGFARSHPAVTNYLLGLRIGTWGVLGSLVLLWLARGNFVTFRYWRGFACVWLVAGELVLAGALWVHAHRASEHVVARSRSFYGTLKVCEYYQHDPDQHYFLLEHGRITHGFQFTAPDKAALATSYYSRDSGIARAVRALPEPARHLGVVGLGTGTMAAFARAGDRVRLYEINPDVVRVAASPFTYLSNCAGKVELVLGDARLSLEREPPQAFDLLTLDAFSSDAIPVHLLTKEAFEVYERHVKTNGIIAVHISNHYLDLEPVVVNLAKEFGYALAIVDQEEAATDDEDEDNWWIYASTWVLLSHDEALINAAAIQEGARAVGTNLVQIPLWTDDFASLFQILQ